MQVGPFFCEGSAALQKILYQLIPAIRLGNQHTAGSARRCRLQSAEGELLCFLGDIGHGDTGRYNGPCFGVCQIMVDRCKAAYNDSLGFGSCGLCRKTAPMPGLKSLGFEVACIGYLILGV